MRGPFPNGWGLTRRRVVAGGVGILATVTAAFTARRVEVDPSMIRGTKRSAGISSSAGVGRLLSRPGPPTSPVGPGLHRLGLDPTRDALLSIPAGYRPDRPAPFALSLHGAGGDQERGLYPLRDVADEAGMILLAPASRSATWDVIRGGYGPDITFIDRALALAFDRCAVDPAKLAVAGFSDGASYALSIGITNGDLFRHVLAFSPGFMAPEEPRGGPRCFVSHGTGDAVLPIDRTSRRIVPQLEQAGYEVTYREFEGPHTVPAEVAREALEWFVSPPSATPVAMPAATPVASPAQSSPLAGPGNGDRARTGREGRAVLTLHTFGDSILDCGDYNDRGLDPGQLLVRNDDRLFPEFRGRDLSTDRPAHLDHRAVDGATVDDLPDQARDISATGASVAMLTIGGNDLLRGLLVDSGPGIDAFAGSLEAFLATLPIRPVLIGTVYDPTFGDDARDFTGIDPALARRNYRRLNAVLAEVAGCHGQLVDLHAHFLTGDATWYTQTIEPSLRGASEIRRCFLPYLQAISAQLG